MGLPSVLAAHDIPNDITINAFLRPTGNHLQLLLRVPMKALRDIDFPKQGPGFLDIEQSGPTLREAVAIWIVSSLSLYEEGASLERPTIVAVRASLPSDRSFESFDSAMAHLEAQPLLPDTELMWDQAMVDVALDYPIHSAASKFSINPDFGRFGLRVLTLLRFIPPDGAVRPFEFGGNPGLIQLDPAWHQAALRFARLGVLHILDGADHLLFLLCLVIPFRRIRPLVLIVTSFTVAHSVALFATAYGMAPEALWFRPLVESLIAISIVYMALENIIGSDLKRRWLVAFGFGLIHGFGFSFVLHETFQFAGSHLLTALFSFNLGAELGQVLVIAACVPMLSLVFRWVPERVGTIILSAFVAHTGWHWTLDRVDQLLQFPLEMPAFDAALIAAILRWCMLVVILVALAWITALVQRRLLPVQPKEKS